MARTTQPVETAPARLSRLLTMVPWLVNRQGIDLDVAARDLGITVEQLESDLELLFVCGYGQMPDELIDANWEDGQVYLRNAETIAKPLRLGLDEAVALMVGLRALLALPGLDERDAVERALAKLEAATGSVGQAAASVAVQESEPVDTAILGRARAAVERRRRVHLSYHVPGRDESTERDVDPLRVISMDGRFYLEGWCHRAEAMRMFRLDRVEALDVLAQKADPPSEATMRDLGQGIFQPGDDDELVTLRLDRPARWIMDYYQVEAVRDLGDGVSEVDLRTADTQWLVRLMLRLGGQARVVAPAALRQEVARAARDALTTYDGSGQRH